LEFSWQQELSGYGKRIIINYKEIDMEIQKIEKESTALITTAGQFNIINNDVYVEAMNFAKSIKLLVKEVEDTFDPVVSKAHSTWKEAIAQKNKHLEPLNQALALLDGKGKTFRREQELIRLEAERKARELAQKEADRLAKQAAKAAESGKEAKAEELQQRAEELKASTPIVESKVSKIAGIPIRTNYKFKMIDEKLIPREYLTPDTVKIGQVVRATKGTLSIPGIEIYTEDSSL